MQQSEPQPATFTDIWRETSRQTLEAVTDAIKCIRSLQAEVEYWKLRAMVHRQRCLALETELAAIRKGAVNSGVSQ